MNYSVATNDPKDFKNTTNETNENKPMPKKVKEIGFV